MDIKNIDSNNKSKSHHYLPYLHFLPFSTLCPTEQAVSLHQSCPSKATWASTFHSFSYLPTHQHLPQLWPLKNLFLLILEITFYLFSFYFFASFFSISFRDFPFKPKHLSFSGLCITIFLHFPCRWLPATVMASFVASDLHLQPRPLSESLTYRSNYQFNLSIFY